MTALHGARRPGAREHATAPRLVEQAAARPLHVRVLGRWPYDEALALQETLVTAVIEGREPEQLLLLEHPPVYTLGRGADAADLRDAPARLGIPVYRVGRGGGATYHGPGQLVAYPIVRLRSGGRDVHGYVRALEQALVDTCAAFGVAATTPAGQTGVWVADRKIASIGIGVRRGVAWHGIALNVAADLSPFAAITVCRSDGLRMIDLATAAADAEPATASSCSLASVAPVCAAALARQLGCRLAGEAITWP